MTTLVSFLGKQFGGYKSATYQFSDGTLMENQKYMGLTLYEKIKPQKLILLGTSGSMWDVFLESGSDGLEEQWLAISDAVNSDQVTEAMLIPFSKYLTQILSISVECILISPARNEIEQISILSKLSELLVENEQVVLDITHSFRHLPLIALVAARFLKVIKNIDIKQIYYGNFLHGEPVHPVLELKGLLTMLDWIDALGTFDKDGDYAAFSSLLIQQNFASHDALQLEQAGFFERTNNSSKAKEKLSNVFGKLEQLDTPIFSLFKQQLLSRLTWFKANNRGLREQQLAQEYLGRKDYVRAVIYAMEGLISHQLFKSKQDENDFSVRENQQRIMSENSESFKKLKILRNALAHGVRARDNQKEVLGTLSDEQKMQKSLVDRFKHLLD